MSEILTPSLPSNVKHCQLDGRDIYLLGTAHISAASVEDARASIQILRPDSVCVELCQARHDAMVDRERWKKMDIFQIVRKGKAAFLLGQLILSSFYQRLAEKIGVEPGAEMREAIEQANIVGAELVLADRSIEITLKRVWRHLSLWSKIKMMAQAIMAVGEDGDLNAEDIDHLRQEGTLEGAMEAFAEAFPQVKERLIDERDIYLAQKIRAAPGQTILAVVGAGHVAGIQKYLHEDICTEALDQVPLSSRWGSVLKWVLPLLIIALPFLGLLGHWDIEPLKSLWVWGISHSILAGLGAMIAFAHPLAILATCIAAPFTSLNPMMAAGWVGGMVQLVLKRPTVEDLEDLPRAIVSVSGFWKNPVTRVLLVVALGNLGSSLGTLISGFWVFSHAV